MRRIRSTTIASVLVLFQLGVVALACPMPVNQAMPDEPAMSAQCAESHDGSVPDRVPNELCRARMAAEGTALVRDRASDASAQSADLGANIVVAVQVAPLAAQFDSEYTRSEPHHHSPPNLKYRVIRI